MRTPSPAPWIGLALAALLAACGKPPDLAAEPAASSAPVVVQVCGQPQTYASAPKRAVTHDVNITEMFLFLGLGDRLVGYSGISSAKEIDPQFQAKLDATPMLAKQGMNLEAMLNAQADFVFGGWSYGFREGQVTPQRLAEYGIASYVLTESCIRVQARERVSLADALQDMRNVAQIFRIGQQAASQIEALATHAQALEARTQGVAHRPRVFVFDSGTDIPVTVGRFGMPRAMIDAAGGTNIFDDIPNNWPKGNWEDVIARDPEWIVIVDYGLPKAQGKIDYLLGKPELASVSAIRNRRFFVMSYAAATPGPRNIPVAVQLAQQLHPDLFTARGTTPP